MSGCLFIPQEDKYAIFAYLPSEGANGSVFIDLKEPAFAEMSSLLGTLRIGKIKDIKEMQAAVLTYDDKSSAGIIQMKTALGIEDLIGGIPQYYIGLGSYTNDKFVNETRIIGGMNVTLLYTKYDTDKKNPVCTWREGEWLKVLYYQRAYSGSYSQCTFPPGLTCVSYTLNQSGELYLKLGQGTGHNIKINSILCNASEDYYGVPNVNAPLKNSITLTSGSSADLAGGSSGNTVVCSGISGGEFSGRIYINYTEIETGLERVAVGSLSLPVVGSTEKEKRCDTILESRFDTGRAKELLQESAGIGSSIVTSGTIFGEGMVQAENHSTYVAVFGDDVGDYGVVIAKGDETGSNLCYSDSYGTAKAEIVKRNNKEACIMNYGGSTMYSLYSLFGSEKQFLNIQRKVGEYSITLLAFAKDSEEKVKSKAEDIIFGITLPGDEVKWTDKMNLHVKVYETFEGGFDQQPVADAKVELYNESYAYPVYDSYGARKQEPIKTVHTDDNGIADFNGLDVGRYTLSASKPGYSKNTEYVYPGQSMNISIMLEPVKPIRVTVRESNSYSGGTLYAGNAIAGAKVDLYNSSSSSYSSYESMYSLVKTVYTNDNGVADFGKMDIDRGKVEVSKEGYYNTSQYLSSYYKNITAYLSKIEMNYNYYSSNNTGEPLVVTVKTSSSTQRMVPIPIAGARVDVYNKTLANSYTLVLTNYTDSKGIANFGKTNIESGKLEALKEGYQKGLWFFSAEFVRNTTIFLSERQPMTVHVSGSSSYSNYSGISGAKVELYNKSVGGYTLVKTVYSDSKGAAEFGKIEVDEAKIVVSKNGYYTSTKIMPYTVSAVILLTEVIGNASTDYPLTQMEGNGCINPNKQGAPPEWVIGSPDGKGACFWESSPVFGTFGKAVTFSKLNLTVSANSVSVNKPLEVLTSESADCYEEALAGSFTSYKHYATFTPDAKDSFKGYAVSNGTVSSRCIAVKDARSDGYGYYIDSVRVYP